MMLSECEGYIKYKTEGTDCCEIVQGIEFKILTVSCLAENFCWLSKSVSGMDGKLNQEKKKKMQKKQEI